MSDQFILSLTLAGLLISFIWSKLRYDALTIGALMILIAVGVIPASDAFLGFSHPAVLTVALVLVISLALRQQLKLQDEKILKTHQMLV